MARVYPQSVHEGSKYATGDGDIRVLRYYSALEVEIEFIDTGYKRMASAGEIRRGRIKDHYKPSVFGIGYLGVGGFKANSRRVKSKAYNTWHNMIQRCYSEKYQEKYPYCTSCKVVPEWHNFQNFAKWYYDNYIEGYDLDKDLKVLENKIYGPEFCTYVPQEINRGTKNSKQIQQERFNEHNNSKP